MSEQIQSLLNKMEDKFEKSFSEINLQEPLSKDLNPESALKYKQNHADNKILDDLDDDHLTEIKGFSNEKENSPITQQSAGNKFEISIENSDQFQENSLTGAKQNKRKLFETEFKNQPQFSHQNAQNSQSRDQVLPSQDQNPFYYKQLTMKLQKALQKISSEKSIPQLKKSSSFYDRIQQFQTKKKREIERRKQQLQEKEINSVKDRPLINSHSRAIVSQISNDPIYVRCDRIIEKKKEKEQEYKKIKEQRQKKQYEKYKQEFDAYMNDVKQKYEGKTIRSPEEYYSEMMTWAKHKERNIQSKTTQINEKLLTQNTFKPIINSKSQKILNRNKQKRVPIYERQPKQKEQAFDPNCTFKPKINKSNFYKKISYYQSQF